MNTEKMFIEYSEYLTENRYMVKPLEHKGFNKHFVNLVSADVFMPKKVSFFETVKRLFK